MLLVLRNAYSLAVVALDFKLLTQILLFKDKTDGRVFSRQNLADVIESPSKFIIS